MKHLKNKAILSNLEKATFTDFAELSKYLRKQKNLSQVELAEKFNRVKGYAHYIAHVETNRRPPSPDLLKSYSKLFGVKYDLLVKYALNGIMKTAEEKFHAKYKKAKDKFYIK